MTIDHDAIAARVRLMSAACDCDTDYCEHAEAHDDAPDYEGMSAAYLDLHDEVKRLRAERDRFEAALEEIADGLKGIAREIQIGPDDEGREIYDMVQAMQWDARQALKGDSDE